MHIAAWAAVGTYRGEQSQVKTTQMCATTLHKSESAGSVQ